MDWERRGAGRDVNDQRTCIRAKNQLGKDVRSKVMGERGQVLWEMIPDAAGLQRAGGLVGERIQSSGRGTVRQGLRELTSKIETYPSMSSCSTRTSCSPRPSVWNTLGAKSRARFRVHIWFRAAHFCTLQRGVRITRVAVCAHPFINTSIHSANTS